MYQSRVLDQQEIIDELVSEISRKVFLKHPELLEEYGEKGRSQTITDLQKHFHHLQTAYRLEAPELFVEHIKWLFNVLTSRGIEISFVLTGLSILKESLNGVFSTEKERFYRNCLAEAMNWMREHLQA